MNKSKIELEEILLKIENLFMDEKIDVISTAFFYNSFYLAFYQLDEISENLKDKYQTVLNWLKNNRLKYLENLFFYLLIFDLLERIKSWKKSNTMWAVPQYFNDEIESIKNTLNSKSVINSTDKFLKSALVSLLKLNISSTPKEEIINKITDIKNLISILNDDTHELNALISSEKISPILDEIKKLDIEQFSRLQHFIENNDTKDFFNEIYKCVELSEEDILTTDDIKQVIKFLTSGRHEYIEPEDELYVVVINGLKRFMDYLLSYMKPKKSEAEINKIQKRKKLEGILNELCTQEIVSSKFVQDFIFLFDNNRCAKKINWIFTDWILYLVIMYFVECKFIVLQNKETIDDYICSSFNINEKEINKKVLKDNFRRAKNHYIFPEKEAKIKEISYKYVQI